jgi:hypothetical protein
MPSNIVKAHENKWGRVLNSLGEGSIDSYLSRKEGEHYVP